VLAERTDTAERQRLALVDHQYVDVAQHVPRRRMRRCSIENCHGTEFLACRQRQGCHAGCDLELGEHDIHAADGGGGVVGAHGRVRPLGHDDAVLCVAEGEHVGGAGGVIHRAHVVGVEADLPHRLPKEGSLDVGPDRSAHACLGAAPCCGDRLVEPLAAGVESEARSQDGLARLREPGETDEAVRVDAADDADAPLVRHAVAATAAR